MVRHKIMDHMPLIEAVAVNEKQLLLNDVCSKFCSFGADWDWNGG